ncbi:hypothetical protein MTBPR1_80178 [Candidatus Terasakiella magnetica]|uniref:Uncharacterized protein n=1 Tax=Candidatus Terasakiella magnetica TaxID=1867952 RepID=A0A1C3RLG9_9PROT|nr:hypothetical protein MTBPR1_80178 [Candidatus Terasakiella magnetica]
MPDNMDMSINYTSLVIIIIYNNIIM